MRHQALEILPYWLRPWLVFRQGASTFPDLRRARLQPFRAAFCCAWRSFAQVFSRPACGSGSRKEPYGQALARELALANRSRMRNPSQQSEASQTIPTGERSEQGQNSALRAAGQGPKSMPRQAVGRYGRRPVAGQPLAVAEGDCQAADRMLAGRRPDRGSSGPSGLPCGFAAKAQSPKVYSFC